MAFPLAIAGLVARKGLDALVNRAIAANEFAKSVPQLENEVTVEVVGQPGAEKRDLYLLALATAMGIVRRSDPGVSVGGRNFYILPPPGALAIEYDAADNWVRCRLAYRTNTLVAITALALNRQAPKRFYEQQAVYSGPDDHHEGAPFNFTSVIAPGVPTSSQADGLPTLPYIDKAILTSSPSCFDPDPNGPGAQGRAIPSPNPKPPGDNRSRGVAYVDPNPGGGNIQARLIPLVFAALSPPGSPALGVVNPPTAGPLGG